MHVLAYNVMLCVVPRSPSFLALARRILPRRVCTRTLTLSPYARTSHTLSLISHLFRIRIRTQVKEEKRQARLDHEERNRQLAEEQRRIHRSAKALRDEERRAWGKAADLEREAAIRRLVAKRRARLEKVRRKLLYAPYSTLNDSLIEACETKRRICAR